MAAWRGVAPLASVAVSDELIENCVLDGRCDRRAQKSTVRHERESPQKIPRSCAITVGPPAARTPRTLQAGHSAPAAAGGHRAKRLAEASRESTLHGDSNRPVLLLSVSRYQTFQLAMAGSSCTPAIKYYPLRSEERRVGKEGRSRWSPYHLKKKTQKGLEGHNST